MIWILLTIGLLAFYILSRGKLKNYPPGPLKLPLVGSALFMNIKLPYETFLKWSQQYGPIVYLKMASQEMVVVTDAELIREALNHPASTGRPSSDIFHKMQIDKGLVFTNGEQWKTARRFTLFHLRNFGMGKSKMEDDINDQIKRYLDDIIDPNCGKPQEITHSFNVCIVNIIWKLVSGETIDIKNDKMLRIMETAYEIEKNWTTITIVSMFPILLRILPDSWSGVGRILELLEKPQRELIHPAVSEHKRRLQTSQEPDDYIDSCLQEQRCSPQFFSDDQVARCVFDLFFAGSDSTATTLRWAFCFLCSWPETQRRIHEELAVAVPDGRMPSLDDRPQMPYTEAFIMETQRLGDIVPAGVPHAALEDFQLAGYTVPKGAQIIPLLTAVHKNPVHFPQPNQFRPQRFLDSDNKLKPSKMLMPFSVGRRSCLGESLVRTELFLFLTGCLQRYSFRFQDGFKHDLGRNMERGGFVAEPTKFHIIATRR